MEMMWSITYVMSFQLFTVPKSCKRNQQALWKHNKCFEARLLKITPSTVDIKFYLNMAPETLWDRFDVSNVKHHKKRATFS